MPVKSWLTELLVNDSKQCRTVVSRINIPASTTSIPKNAGDVKAKLMPDGVIQSRNSYGFDGFGGMCPPKGDKPHHYMLTVYAVDEDKLQFSKDDMTLEGSVQRDQNRVRINAQLIDAKSGAHLWADHFEEDVADLFKLQDQVVARLANTLRFELVKAEAEKGTRSGNPDAIDLTMRGRALMYQTLRRQQVTKDNNNAMRALFEQALKIDPNDAEALTGDAITYFFEYLYGWGNSETDYDAKILGQAERAIALAPDTIRAHWTKSAYLSLGLSRRFNEALRAADAGLAVDPNFAPLYSARATAEISLGRFEQAKSDVRHAMRLSPRDPNMGIWQVQLGDVEIGAGHTETAIGEYQKAFDAGYRGPSVYLGLAAAHALEGKMDEAKSALAEARRINPRLTLKWYREHMMELPNRLEGLRKAGVPEE